MRRNTPAGFTSWPPSASRKSTPRRPPPRPAAHGSTRPITTAARRSPGTSRPPRTTRSARCRDPSCATARLANRSWTMPRRRTARFNPSSLATAPPAGNCGNPCSRHSAPISRCSRTASTASARCPETPGTPTRPKNCASCCWKNSRTPAKPWTRPTSCRWRRFFRFVPLWLLAVDHRGSACLAGHPPRRRRHRGGSALAGHFGRRVARGLGVGTGFVTRNDPSRVGSTRRCQHSRNFRGNGIRQPPRRDGCGSKNEQAAEGQSLGETFRESDSEWKARMARGRKNSKSNSPGSLSDWKNSTGANSRKSTRRTNIPSKSPRPKRTTLPSHRDAPALKSAR